MARALLLLVALLALAAGAYLGSAGMVSHAASERPSRAVYLRSGDVAIFGGVQCIAAVEGGAKRLLCQRRPRSTARYEAAIYRTAIFVYKMGKPDDPVYVTP